jgi:hypothetical protein
VGEEARRRACSRARAGHRTGVAFTASSVALEPWRGYRMWGREPCGKVFSFKSPLSRYLGFDGNLRNLAPSPSSLLLPYRIRASATSTSSKGVTCPSRRASITYKYTDM